MSTSKSNVGGPPRSNEDLKHQASSAACTIGNILHGLYLLVKTDRQIIDPPPAKRWWIVVFHSLLFCLLAVSLTSVDFNNAAAVEVAGAASSFRREIAQTTPSFLFENPNQIHTITNFSYFLWIMKEGEEKYIDRGHHVFQREREVCITYKWNLEKIRC